MVYPEYMSNRNLYTVKEAAVLAGVSVRTLHHYDQIGLLTPRRENSYRMYCKQDLEKLQQILFYRELGFPLKEIRAVFEDPHFSRRDALAEHRRKLRKRRIQINRLIKTIDYSIKEIDGGIKMTDKQLFSGFDIDSVLEDQKKYEKEVDEKYDLALAAESRGRVGSYSKEKMGQVLKKGGDILGRIADFMESGSSNDSFEVQELVKEYQSYIDKSFYPCSLEIYRGLADLYMQDLRFTEYFEKTRKGLAVYMSEAMKFYCGK